VEKVSSFMQQQLVELFIFHDFFLYQIAPQNIAMKLELTGILIGLSLLVFVAAMAEAKKEGQVPEEEDGQYIKGLTAEEIMNLPDISDDEDEETAGMTMDEIIERANQMGQGRSADAGGDAPYIVQGDIAMTKEQYEEYMAEWKKQEAELIAKGEIKPDK